MDYGTESSSDISATRRRGLLEEIRAVQGRLEEFTDHHAARLDPPKVDVEKRISDAINADLKDFLGVLRDDAEVLRQARLLGAGQRIGSTPENPAVRSAFLPGGPERVRPRN